ncbi:hypothetical protein A5746_00835 [Mycolicibacterium conceptionense]|uniref:hypothetical protein n=1 Tax=Mycolicibacterium conceptionense TaxID=451644 RepID=UPI0002EF977E|nr:hypothetical protein [Mycolicibacterium conceptionense]OBK09010.1 hypothetical protein A5639_11795 [Mycolicibacterium conceptionense]OMB98719.1 hypothetical protein A5746_00835 [Mycolicibacterium conceptionense]
MATVRAKEAFSYNDVNGVPVNVAAGALFDANDPDVKKRAHLFEEPEVAAARRKRRNSGVEDATAEPGARRSVSTTRRARDKGYQSEAKSNDDSTGDDGGTGA